MSNSNTSEKVFWLKLGAVMLALLLLHAAMIPLADGSFSLGLYKVSGPRQENLVIGTSRIAQALQPSTLKNEMGVDFLNFAIDVTTTSYSEMYNKAIQSKIDPATTNGTFILSLDPWSLCREQNPETKELLYPEKETALAKTWSFNAPLNIEYLIHDCNKGWGSILLAHLENNKTVNCHKDGWVEVEPTSTDSAFRQARKENKIKARRLELENTRFAQDRLIALEELIVFLKSKGDVYFVRLPVDPDFFQLEEELMPDFDQVVDSIMHKYEVSYYDMQHLNGEVEFNDGHHINKKFAPFVSQKVAQWIALQRLGS